MEVAWGPQRTMGALGPAMEGALGPQWREPQLREHGVHTTAAARMPCAGQAWEEVGGMACAGVLERRKVSRLRGRRASHHQQQDGGGRQI